MFSIFLVFVIAFAVFYRISYTWRKRRLIRMVNQFEGPPTLPFIGNGLLFLGSPEEVLKKMIKIWYKYEGPIRIWLLWRPYILISKPEDIQTVASKTLHKDDLYEFIAEMLGDGIFTLPVEKWKIHRRLLNSAFNPSLLKDYFVEIFNRKNQNLVKKLEKYCGTGEYLDLRLDFTENSISTITETTMGYEDKTTLDSFRDFGEAVIKAAFLVSKRIYTPLLYPSFIFNLYINFKGYRKYYQLIRDLPLKVLAIKREQLFQKVHEQPIPEGVTVRTERNLLGVLLESYDNHYFTDQELKDEITSVMFGGSETTVVTAGFLLLMLAMNPDVQERVYQEIRGVVRDEERCVFMEDVAKLYYLEQCIKETLRRFPVVPVIFRHAKEDIEISNNQVIPAGANIALSIMRIHHDKNIYPNPFDWNPENFNPEIEAKRHKCSFIPFSTGVRGCIGQKYASILLKIQLTIFLRKYKVYTRMKMEDIELVMDLIIRSKNGYPVRLEYRNQEINTSSNHNL